MKDITITVFPFVSQTGSLKVPDELKTREEIKDYIDEHWDEIDFEPRYQADFDYSGADYDFYD